MSSLAAAIAQRCNDIADVRSWWSAFSPVPSAPIGGPFITWWYDETRERITHVSVKGRTCGWGEDWTGNDSGDGRWYAPITVDGALQFGALPYPLCFDLNGTPTLVGSDTELQNAINVQYGEWPLAITNAVGSTAACFDPNITPPGSVPAVDLTPLCTVGDDVIVHRGTRTSWKRYCEPPPPFGAGSANPETGPMTTPFVANGASYEYVYPSLPYTGAASLAVLRNQTMWVGPIEVHCGNPILEFTVDYDSVRAHDPSNGNAAHGFAVLDTSGVAQPIQGTTTEIVGDCTGTSFPTAQFPINPAAFGPNVATFQMLNPAAAGDKFWFQVVQLAGTINSVTVECL